MDTTGDNVFRVKIYEGTVLGQVNAAFIGKDMERFEVSLNDAGSDGDSVGGDNVFSVKIPEKEFGFYRVIIEAIDSFGNKTIEESPAKVLLH